MKYIASFLMVIFAIFITNIGFAQEPCTHLNTKIKQGDDILIPTIVSVPQAPLNDINLVCPANIQAVIEDGQNYATVTWDPPTATTICPQGGLVITQTSNYTSGGDFYLNNPPLTEYTVTYEATDNCNNHSYCSFQIQVVENAYKPAVIFVHGLGGSEGSWGQASTWTNTTYGVKTYTPTYTADQGLNVAGQTLNTNIATQVSAGMDLNIKENRLRNFIIAHSQGGIVSQYAELMKRKTTKPYLPSANVFWDDEIYYGGIVTFATSHQGAFILNSLVEDDSGNWVYDDNNPNTKSRMEEFLSFSEKVLVQDIVDAKIQMQVTDWFGINDKIQDVADAFLTKVSNQVNQLLISSQVNPTTLGYQVNPPTTATHSINQINEMFAGTTPVANPIPKLAFYSEITPEQEKAKGEIVWREIFWTMHSANQEPLNNVYFGSASELTAPDDNDKLENMRDGQQVAEDHKRRLLAKMIDAQKGADYHWQFVNSVVQGTCGFCYNHHLKKAKKWQRKADVSRNAWNWYLTANDQWKTLIGATKYTTGTSCRCECVETDYDDNGQAGEEVVATWTIDDPNCEIENCSDLEENSHQECQKVVVTLTERKLSDGVVPAESAANMAGATLNENAPGFTKDDFRLRGDIHQQVRNSMELRRVLEGNPNKPNSKALFKGQYHEQFKLD